MAPAPVLFCSHVVEWGGAERVLADLLVHIDRDRFAPHLVVPGDGPLTQHARELGVPVAEIPIGGGSPLSKALSLPGAARALRRIATTTGARLIYANSMIAGYAGVLAQRPELPCVWHLHIVTDSRLARRALRRAAAVITPSQLAAQAVRRTGAQVIQNGVPAEFFARDGAAPLRDELGIPPSTPLCGIVGRLDPHKGHEVLLRAVAALTPRAAVAIVGDAAFADSQSRVRGERERLVTLTETLGLTDRVHFLGHRDDTAAVIRSLDVLVAPSVAPESAPRTIAEAQAAGRAVIASRIGGVTEMVRDGITGRLVAPGDVNALRAALQELLGDDSEREAIGVAAREHARSNYAMPEFAKRIAAVLAATMAPTD
ncbi:MAG: glycosyltransferase [bacterium]|nr:glycosyltransferase [bacterium]